MIFYSKQLEHNLANLIFFLIQVYQKFLKQNDPHYYKSIKINPIEYDYEKYLFNKVLFPSLWRTYGEIDRATLDSFWVKEMSSHELSDYEYYAIKDNMLHLKQRLKKVSRYTEKNNVKTSQGESGRWD